MREENYFEKKLEMSKDKLAMAKRKLEHFDIQMEVLKVRFEHDKKVYNDQIIHMQYVVTEMKKRIPKLEKRLKKGYRVFDVRANKGYKSFEDMHAAQLETKRLQLVENQRLLEEKFAKRKALKEKPQIALTEADKEIVESIKIQESLQEDHDIEMNQEKQLENLRKKREFYEQELEKLGAEVKEPEVKFDAVGNEIKGMKLEELEEMIKPSEIKKEITLDELELALEKDLVKLPDKEVIPHIDIVKTPNDDVSQLKSISQQIGEQKDEINGMVKEMEWLLTRHQDWMGSYTTEEGGKAIYSGRITNGFRSWCEEKGYKIGD